MSAVYACHEVPSIKTDFFLKKNAYDFDCFLGIDHMFD